MMRRRNTVDHETVVEAAMAVAFDRGLSAITLSTLAYEIECSERDLRDAGVDRDAMIAEAFQRIVRQELASVKRLVLSEPDPIDQLRALLATLALPVRADVDSVWLESWSLGRRIPVLGTVVCEAEGAWHEFVASVLRYGVSARRFGPIDAEHVAAQILATIDGVNAYALVGYRTDLDRSRLMRSVAENALGITLAEPTTVA